MTDSGARYADHRAKLVYFLYPGAYSRFQAIVGLHSQLARESKVKVQVLVDEKISFEIPVLTEKEPAHKLDISIEGANRLTLLACAPDSTTPEILTANKDIIWANPILIR